MSHYLLSFTQYGCEDKGPFDFSDDQIPDVNGVLTDCFDLKSEGKLGFNATDSGTALPDGSVCLFGGNYDYANLVDRNTDYITTIPPDSCAMEPKQTGTGIK